MLLTGHNNTGFKPFGFAFEMHSSVNTLMTKLLFVSSASWFVTQAATGF